MKKIVALSAFSIFIASVAFAAPASKSVISGEFGNHCAYGLTMGKQVKTDCSVNWKSPQGKTYCFSNEASKQEWAKNTDQNMTKASAEFAKVSAIKASPQDKTM